MIENNTWIKKILLILFFIRLAVSSETELAAKFVKEFYQEKGASQYVNFGCLNNDGRPKMICNIYLKNKFFA